MATAFVAATNGLSADSVVDTVLTTTTPSSTVGDFILCWINCNNGTATAPTITAPTSETWTLVGSITDGSAPQLRAALYYRIVTGTDIANPQWTFSTGANIAWTMAAYRGIDPTVPITNASVLAYGGSNATKTTASVTTTDPGWIASGFGDRSGGGYSAETDTERSYAHQSVYTTPSASWMQDSNADVAAGSQQRTITGPAGTSVGSSFILRLNPAVLTTSASATAVAYNPHGVVSPLKEWMLNKGSMYIAHRGGSVDFTECSAAAYAACAELKIEAIEMPVWKTSDGVYVISHDQTTGRMFGTDLSIPSTTWATLSTMTTTITGEPMARLDEQLALYASSKIIFIDNKADSGNTAFLDYLDTFTNPTGHFVLKGFYNNVMAPLARLRGYTTWGYYYEEDLANLDSTSDKFDLLGIEYNDDQSAWDLVIAKGKPVIGHVALTLNNVNTAFSKGADGVMTGKILSAVPNAPAVTANAVTLMSDTGVTISASAGASTATASAQAFNASTEWGEPNSPDAVMALVQVTSYDATTTSENGQPEALAVTCTALVTAYDAVAHIDSPFWYFVTPTRREYMSARPRHGLFSRMYVDVGVSVLKNDGFYTDVIDPDPADIAAADAAYLGGRIYLISSEEMNALRAAGYGHWVTNTPDIPIPPIDYSAYGVGPYGSGTYGA